MPRDQLFYTDGAALKNIDLPQYPDSAWNWITGKPEDADEAAMFYSRVAAVYRVINMTADAVAHLPFALIDSGGEDFDTSDDWQNKVGFMRNPKELLRLWRLSLFMTNTAYGFMEGNRSVRELRYIVPTTMEPIIDKYEGLIAFKRTLGTDVTRYPLFENPRDNKIFWMFWRDHTTEILPSENTEFKALMNAAGVLYYADEHVRHFFSRGGIKPTMLMVKGVATREEREKVESLWTKIILGTYKFLGKVFNAESIEPIVIGEGVDNIKDSELHKEKIEDIAIAAGIPLSLLLANSANFATAKVEYSTWFRDSVVPKAEMMAEAMNELLFEPLGYQFEFRPEITNTGTQEEHERAGAFAAYVASNIKPSVAAQMLGMELPTDYTDYTQLDDDYLFMLKEKAAASALDMPVIADPKPPKDEVRPDLEKAPKSVSEPTVLTIDQLRELELWQTFAFRKLKREEDLDFPFVCKQLPEHIAADIRDKLPDCKNERDVERAFNLNAPARDDEGLKELALALNKAISVVIEPADEPELEYLQEQEVE